MASQDEERDGNGDRDPPTARAWIESVSVARGFNRPARLDLRIHDFIPNPILPVKSRRPRVRIDTVELPCV
jgi:hypothetical protein